MLSYRHSYHAGNHADVLKHVVLSLCLDYLKQKEKPFIYMDTHAGAGRYLLTSEHAEKTGEYLTGINRIWNTPEKPALLDAYLAVLQYYNRTNALKTYPGSPLMAKHLLRPCDRLLLSELHSSDFTLLRHEFLKDPRTSVIRQDGYHQLKAKLPPIERRGLILIDPSYELKQEYDDAAQSLYEGYRRFSTGTYVLWYPVVLRQQTQRLIQQILKKDIRNVLQIELAVRPDNTQKGMTASGLIVINPPWQLKSQMASLLPWLTDTLVPEGTGKYTLTELVSE